VSELLAVFCCGVFFGAALYITLVQHPAALQVGSSFAGAFFGPMYRRAAPMQVALALVGSLTGLWTWWQGAGSAWLAGALLLFSVVPFTLLRMSSVNQLLLAHAAGREDSETDALLRRWGSLHAARTVLSGLSFVVFLWALAFG